MTQNERVPVSRQRVEAVLDRIRPILQSDGGDIQLVDVQDRRARVRLLGRCAGCPSAHLTLYLGVEACIKEQIPEFDQLLVD